MKITSYDSQGSVIKESIFDDLVPEYVKSFNLRTSVLSLYKDSAFMCTKDDFFGNYLNSKKAENLFNIDYGNYLESSFSKMMPIDKSEDESRIKIPNFENCEFEEKKLVYILNHYGSKSKEQLERARYGNPESLDCLSNSTWILSLVNYANKKAYRFKHRTETDNDAFKMALQSVINRYAFALRRMSDYTSSLEVKAQISILKPFVSSNTFRVETQDLERYYTNKFLMKLLDHIFAFGGERRHEAYCLFRLLRNDDNSKINTISTNKVLTFSVLTQKAPNNEHTFTIKEFNNNQTVICINDEEIESLVDPIADDNLLKILTQTFENIYDGYITSSYKETWDNQIRHRRLAVLIPEKIQSWSYLFYDELSNFTQISIQNSFKEQMCFYKLVYSFVNTIKPQKIVFNGFLMNCFFSILKINNCHDQSGFFEKIYTINEILANADLDDIALMNRISNWNQIGNYKKSIETIDEMISFLEPILNSCYVNETTISIDNLKKMIRNILKNEKFICMVQVKKPTQLLKQMNNNYNCNIALLFNIIGALYGHVFTIRKVSLFKSQPTLAFRELVRPYPNVKKQSNDYKYLTECEDYSSSWSLLTDEKVQIIVDEAKQIKYYKK